MLKNLPNPDPPQQLIFEINMEPTSNNPNISLQSAYEIINFYPHSSHSAKPVLTCSSGPADFAGLFTSNNPAKLKSNENEIMMCAQPFYVGEVDHNIEEIGLMAVKQVRYVDDDEWEEMMKENQKYMKALQKQKTDEVRMLRKFHAKTRERNERGQFIPKKKEIKKKQKKAKFSKQ